MSENSIDLSILVVKPTAEGLRNIQSFFKKMPIQIELIALGAPSLFLHMNGDLIYTKSFKEAGEKVHGDFILILDSSLKIPLAEVLVFLAYFQSDPDLQMLCGDRFSNRKKMSYEESKLERMIRLRCHKFISKLFLIDNIDFLCPFKAFRNQAGLQILSHTSVKRTADIEMILLARQLKFKVQTLPVLWMKKAPDLKTRLLQIKHCFILFFELLYLSLSSRQKE